MTWEEIKLAIQTIYGQYVGSGKLIDDTDNGSTPSALAILVNLVHNRVVGYPAELNCLKETGTITLTGASSYNLKTLLPSLKSVYQVYGINDNQEQEPMGNLEANITPLSGWTIKGDSLIFSGTAPSGTATLQYKSKYMVKDSTGTRQQYFLADADYTVLDASDCNILIFGVGQFINWSSDEEAQNRKDQIKDWYNEAWTNLILHPSQTSQLHSLL